MFISRDALKKNFKAFRSATGCDYYWDTPLPLHRECADNAVAGRIAFRHICVKYYKVGRSGIDWSGTGDQHREWKCQLNRFFHIPHLYEAYKETGDERYPDAAFDYITDWISAHSSRADWSMAPYDNTLNLSIRCQIWSGALERFADSPTFDDDKLADIISSIACQMNYLTGNMAPGNNVRIASADALFTVGLRLAQLPDAPSWKALAVHILNDAFHRQILPDGVHCERNPGYHSWMTDVFEKYWRIKQSRPDLGLAMTTERVAAMHDYWLASTRPNGERNSMNDSAGKHVASRPSSWREKRDKFRAEARLPPELPLTSQNFTSAGQACWRDSWDEDATYVTFDATTWGGCHCHLSRNAIQVHAHGRSLLVDPGTMTYDENDPMMAYGKSTRAHNTMNLNGWNQNRNNPDFVLQSIPGYDLAVGLYNGGYWPGPFTWCYPNGRGAGAWAEHHRTVLWIHECCIMVFDSFLHDAFETPPVIESNWQFSAGSLDLDRERRRAVTNHSDGNVLMLFPEIPPETVMNIHEGEKEPIRGWIRGDNGYAPAPQLSFAAAPIDRASSWTTVIVPFKGHNHPALTAELNHEGTRRTLTLQWQNGQRDTVYFIDYTAHSIDNADQFITDASIVHLHTSENVSAIEGMIAKGTFISPYMKKPEPQPGMVRFRSE